MRKEIEDLDWLNGKPFYLNVVPIGVNMLADSSFVAGAHVINPINFGLKEGDA